MSSHFLEVEGLVEAEAEESEMASTHLVQSFDSDRP